MSKFIVFEGIDGSGKSTQIDLIIKRLIENKVDYSLLREPGTTQISEKIREILLDSKNDISDLTETLLFLAARAQLVEENLQADLKLNKLIICDRYSDSTLAYQGYGRGLNLRSIESIVTQCIKPNAPDFTILLNISPETIEKRLQKRNKKLKKDRLDLESLSFFERVSKGFQSLAYSEPDRYICIDGEKEVEVVHKEIIRILTKKLNIA